MTISVTVTLSDTGQVRRSGRVSQYCEPSSRRPRQTQSASQGETGTGSTDTVSIGMEWGIDQRVSVESH